MNLEQLDHDALKEPETKSESGLQPIKLDFSELIKFNAEAYGKTSKDELKKLGFTDEEIEKYFEKCSTAANGKEYYRLKAGIIIVENSKLAQTALTPAMLRQQLDADWSDAERVEVPVGSYTNIFDAVRPDELLKTFYNAFGGGVYTSVESSAGRYATGREVYEMNKCALLRRCAASMSDAIPYLRAYAQQLLGDKYSDELFEQMFMDVANSDEIKSLVQEMSPSNPGYIRGALTFVIFENVKF